MMPDEKDTDNTSLDRVRADRGLAQPPGFIARRTRELAQQVRELDLGDEIEVVFPDKDLEAAVRKTLERPKGPLTRGHLKRMKELEVGDKAIENLTGLEHAVNLTSLNLDKNQSDQQIVKTIIDLAHNFDLKVIAEGVETQGSLALLQKWGCNYAQGYLLSRPVPVESFIQWYKDNINTDWFSL